MKNNYLDKQANKIVKSLEDQKKLKEIGAVASKLFSFLTGNEEEIYLKKQLVEDTDALIISLKDRLYFFESKKTWNGNIPNLKKEILACENFRKNINNISDIEEIKSTLSKNNEIRKKYGF